MGNLNQTADTMEPIGKQIAAALVKAQKDFGPALKTSTNPHFKSKYADLAACVEAVMDGLHANGIMLMQTTDECGDGVIVSTVFVHESGESVTCGRLHVPASKSDAQGYGSALTYARRYSLMTACGIAPEDDDGNAASKSRKTEKTAPPMTQEQVGEIIALIDTRELTEDERRKAGAWLKGERTQEAAAKMIEKLKALPEVTVE